MSIYRIESRGKKSSLECVVLSLREKCFVTASFREVLHEKLKDECM